MEYPENQPQIKLPESIEKRISNLNDFDFLPKNITNKIKI